MPKFLKILLYFILITLFLFFIVFFLLRIYAVDILCIYADKLFEKKDYAQAYTIYDVIYTYKPKNNEYMHKMTNCLVRMPMTYSVQKKLLEIAQLDDGSDSESLATAKIKKFRAKIYQKFGKTYIYDTIHNGMVIRWSTKNFPLKYFIEPSNAVPEYYFEQTRSAIQDWQRESDEFIKFIPVNNEVSADISIKFRPTATGNSSHDHGEYKVAVTSPIIDNDKILKQMKIVCSIKPHTGEFFTPQQIKTVMEHELGHALGFWGHSKDNETIMYYSLDNPYDYYENRIDTALTEKDINTLKLLYNLAPDISNNLNDIMEKEKFLYTNFLLQSLDNNKEKMIEEAKKLLIEHSGDIGYALSLADTYNANGKYKESIALMQFLTKQTNNRKLLSILFYNISNNYISLEDFENAMNYAQKAYECVKNVDNQNLIAYVKFCMGNLTSAEKDFQTIIDKNPTYIPAFLGLADVYIKQKKYGKARHVLKQLLKNNPNALEDKSLNSYKLLAI